MSILNLLIFSWKFITEATLQNDQAQRESEFYRIVSEMKAEIDKLQKDKTKDVI